MVLSTDLSGHWCAFVSCQAEDRYPGVVVVAGVQVSVTVMK